VYISLSRAASGQNAHVCQHCESRADASLSLPAAAAPPAAQRLSSESAVPVPEAWPLPPPQHESLLPDSILFVLLTVLIEPFVDVPGSCASCSGASGPTALTRTHAAAAATATTEAAEATLTHAAAAAAAEATLTHAAAAAAAEQEPLL
jgi:hypothetical protein